MCRVNSITIISNLKKYFNYYLYNIEVKYLNITTGKQMNRLVCLYIYLSSLCTIKITSVLKPNEFAIYSFQLNE